jgi:Metallo-peptidase family M12B Reprolysin-like/Secretion system C-terminal sorting domain
MKKHLLTLGVLAIGSCLSAQTGQYWQASQVPAKSIKTNKAVERPEFAKKFKLFQLDIEPLRQELFSSFSKTGRNAGKKIIISLPNAQGQIEDFEVHEASNFDPQLQARFPQIRAYSGVGITDPLATLKLSIAPEGIQTMVLRDQKASEFIEAYAQDQKTYAVFSNTGSSRSAFKCSAKDSKILNEIMPKIEKKRKSSAGTLKTLRMAQSCTAEYANYFGANAAADEAKVLTAYNNTYSRCNGIFERELGLHINLINRTTEVIFYDTDTDPYSNSATGAGKDGDVGAWNRELMNTLHNTLGDDAFDIGHLFGGSGGGGNAGSIGSICKNDMTLDTDGDAPAYPTPQNYKGSGFTSPSDGVPAGSNFDLDYVAHEIGHQLGANHTFTHKNENNTPQVRVQVEVGSGTTIMGYAGVTEADITDHPMEYFHTVSIDQIQQVVNNAACVGSTAMANATPTVTASANITIPISTPFALDCRGQDTNTQDRLTYSWEQTNVPKDSNFGTKADETISNATESKASGPIFASFAPSAQTYRYFPKMETVMANQKTTDLPDEDSSMHSEALPSVDRTLNFTVTVRDNAPYRSTEPISIGQTNTASLVVTVDDFGGAFTVTSQNEADTVYEGGGTQTVTWSKGATDVAPFNATHVDILITYDNGATWQVLAANVTNDGLHELTMPNPTQNQTNCRLMVRSAITEPVATAQSYFFNVNTTPFALNNNVVLGTKNIDKLVGFELFPNPSKGQFNIKFVPNAQQTFVRVYDSNGRLVFVQTYSNKALFDESINLEGLGAGAYSVSVTDGEKQTVKKVIIK